MTEEHTGICARVLEQAFAKVRSLILGHGGDIEIDEISPDGILNVRLSGACKSCPNIAMTYVGPIRSYLMDVPGVKDVVCKQSNAGPRALARMAKLLNARPFER